MVVQRHLGLVLSFWFMLLSHRWQQRSCNLSKKYSFFFGSQFQNNLIFNYIFCVVNIVYLNCILFKLNLFVMEWNIEEIRNNSFDLFAIIFLRNGLHNNFNKILGWGWCRFNKQKRPFNLMLSLMQFFFRNYNIISFH